MKVFTFWEPRECLPGYIRLCLRTWERYLPDGEIVVLDDSTIGQWVPQSVVDGVTVRCEKMTLPKQADVYRALVLERHGGVWLDADTIITPKFASSGILSGPRSEVVFFGTRGHGVTNLLSGAFVWAEPHAEIVYRWAMEAVRRVSIFAGFARNPLLRAFRRSEWRWVRSWNFFLNDILDPMIAEVPSEKLRLLDLHEFGVFPHGQADGCCSWDRYQEFYFKPGNLMRALDYTQGLIMLQNSWTPSEFRAMDERTFLSQDVRLASILRELLKD